MAGNCRGSCGALEVALPDVVRDGVHREMDVHGSLDAGAWDGVPTGVAVVDAAVDVEPDVDWSNVAQRLAGPEGKIRLAGLGERIPAPMD